jgi:hypothetical protein
MKKPFNKLSPAEAERLSFLMEEMGEALQIIGKIFRHGYDNYHPDDPEKTCNRILLSKELGHVYCALQLLVIPQDISGFILEMSRADKRKSVKKWMHHQNYDKNGDEDGK